MLGLRQPELYGRETLADIEQACRERAADPEIGIEFRRSNCEGQIVDWIQEARQHADGIVINAGALSDTAETALDALHKAQPRMTEGQLSCFDRRDAFRLHSDVSYVSYVSTAACGVIAGPGSLGHTYAPDAFARWSADAAA